MKICVCRNRIIGTPHRVSSYLSHLPSRPLMDFSCDYDAPRFVDFSSIDTPEDDNLAEKYFEIDHENKSQEISSTSPMAQLDVEPDAKPKIPAIVVTPPETSEPPKRPNNIVTSWGPKRIISLSKKVSKEASDKRDLTKKMTRRMEADAERRESSSSSSRRSSGRRVSFVSSKVLKHSRRSSSGTANNVSGSEAPSQKSASSTIGNCLKKVLRKSEKPSGGPKPLKAAATVSAFKISQMIQSYQGIKLSRTSNLSKDLKMIRGRASEMFFRRDSSVGSRESGAVYVPIAERIMKMENHIPDRYRTLPSRGRSAASNGGKPSLTRSCSNGSVPRATTCKSPKLLTKDRHRSRTRSSYEELPSTKPKRPVRKVVSSSESVDRVQPAGCCSKTYKRTKSATTLVQPFSFDQKIAESETRKANRIKEILEKEKQEREFKANSAPNFQKPINLPIRELICPTIVEPFHLDTDSRQEARMKKREENGKLEDKKLKEMTKFKARPVKNGSTFSPVPSAKAPVEVQAFELHSNRRAQEREAYEQRKREKEMELFEQEKIVQERKKQEEMEEIRRLRKETIVKSNPVPNYPPAKILPSTKPITMSKSPKLSNKVRSLTSTKEGGSS